MPHNIYKYYYFFKIFTYLELYRSILDTKNWSKLKEIDKDI